jgi:hypothetical protein
MRLDGSQPVPAGLHGRVGTGCLAVELEILGALEQFTLRGARMAQSLANVMRKRYETGPPNDAKFVQGGESPLAIPETPV